MPYKIKFLDRVVKDYKKLDPAVQRLVKATLVKIASDPEKGKPLSDALKGLYSYRASDYRIVYEIQRKVITVLVIAIGHRREVYDKLKKLLK